MTISVNSLTNRKTIPGICQFGRQPYRLWRMNGLTLQAPARKI